MYFIGSGYVEVVSEDEPRIVFATLSAGQYFGEIALWSDDSKRTASIRAAEMCELYILYKKDFIFVLEKYPEAKPLIQKEIEQRMMLLKEQQSKKKSTSNSSSNSINNKNSVSSNKSSKNSFFKKK
jgi:CRP-like cAMP-binding protein